MFPDTRLRRNRSSAAIRKLSAQTVLTVNDLILPIFIKENCNDKEAIQSMPGVYRHSIDSIKQELVDLTIPAVLVFILPDESKKSETDFDVNTISGFVKAAVDEIKRCNPEIAVIADVCMCPFTSHGHCGIVDRQGRIDNDKTLKILGELAVMYANAGVDIVAPSAMMDGQVRQIRHSLDQNGFYDVLIISYAAKFASCFYGPFREAAQSSPKFGDRKTHQLPIHNRREAVADALLDESEGADWLMVKPALPYLDVLSELRNQSRLPIAAYQVSGEYSMIKLASQAGCIDEKNAIIESLISIKRAGADAIITYFAKEVSKWI